jgi:hypothetical protein
LIDDDYDMIEEIIKHRYDSEGKPSFYVKWKQSTQKTWEEAPSFVQGCSKKFLEYVQTHELADVIHQFWHSSMHEPVL